MADETADRAATDGAAADGGVERNARGARIRANGLSAAKREIFLATLAETLSIQTAAAAAGADVIAFRRLRERDEAFAADCVRAHEYGLETLEGLLAAAAMGQPVPEGFDATAVREVIQRRRASVGTPQATGRVSRVKRVSIVEVERELLRRLAAMKKQRARVAARKRK